MMILPHDFVLYLTCDIVIDSKREERGKANPKKWWKRHQYVGHRIPSLTIISCVLLCTLERWYLLSCDTFLLVLENSKTRKKFEWKRCHKIIFIRCNCKSADKVFYIARETHKLRLLRNLIENVVLSSKIWYYKHDKTFNNFKQTDELEI